FGQKKEDEKLLADRRDFLAKEFANTTPEFTEYGKKFLAKKYHFIVKGDEIVYLAEDKLAVNDVYKSDELKMQITVTALLDEKFIFDPFGTEKLQLVCCKAKVK
ncbi:MAG: hypothetical protein NTV44_03340, partial [Firmicutes bacterium]|nr:hypothetical protein [Bacillota bacterium]